MSGSNKAKNIKRRKEAQDARRSRLFSKLSRELKVAVEEGGDDPQMNPALRLAIQQAKDANMPKEKILKALRGSAQEESLQLCFEAFGPEGAGVWIECATDNRNRTVAVIRAFLRKHHGKLAQVGALQHAFPRRGIIELSPTRDELLWDALIDAGAEDIQERGERLWVSCQPDALPQLQEALAGLGVAPLAAEIQRSPISTVEVSPEAYAQVLAWTEALLQLQDVQAVYHNAVETEGSGASRERAPVAV